MYDYLIVGSGLFGAVFAHEAKQAGKSVLVVERRAHVGAMCIASRRMASTSISMEPISSIRVMRMSGGM